MDRKDILERIVKVTAKVLRVEPAIIKPDSNFAFDLGAESTQSVQLVAAFEEEFDIELEGEEALAVQTVDGAADFVQKYLK